MKFLADEGVDKPIVTALRNAGLNVDYILEFAPGADDEFVSWNNTYPIGRIQSST